MRLGQRAECGRDHHAPAFAPESQRYLVGGIKPHNYCLPVLKRGRHQEALRAAAVSGSRKFFLGSDSAPRERMVKESACGCAGCYSAPYALALCAGISRTRRAGSPGGVRQPLRCGFLRFAENHERGENGAGGEVDRGAHRDAGRRQPHSFHDASAAGVES